MDLLVMSNVSVMYRPGWKGDKIRGRGWFVPNAEHPGCADIAFSTNT
jgi:hypothetical protein